MIEFTLEISNWNFGNQLTAIIFMYSDGGKGLLFLGLCIILILFLLDR